MYEHIFKKGIKLSLEQHIEIIRKVMNDGYNFPVDCCEKTSWFTGYVLKHLGYDVKVIKGDFKAVNGEHHFYNTVNGAVVDITVDQFGKFKYGIINEKLYSQKYGKVYEIYDIDDDISIEDVIDDAAIIDGLCDSYMDLYLIEINKYQSKR